MKECDRCHKEVIATSMSWFNKQIICLDCQDKEKLHPKFKEAVAEDVAAIKKGNFNFSGIGLPGDL